MSKSIANPHIGMLSFQEALSAGSVQITSLTDHSDLYAHTDMPNPGVRRLTYVRLLPDRVTVQAFVNCIFNGQIDGYPCIAIGYAVPEQYRGLGLAKKLFIDVIDELCRQAKNNGIDTIFIEAVTGTDNMASQRVAEAVLNCEQELITDLESNLPAIRYTKQFDTSSGYFSTTPVN